MNTRFIVHKPEKILLNLLELVYKPYIMQNNTADSAVALLVNSISSGEIK